MSSKKPSTFAKITKIVIWVMLIAMVGSSIVGVISLLMR